MNKNSIDFKINHYLVTAIILCLLCILSSIFFISYIKNIIFKYNPLNGDNLFIIERIRNFHFFFIFMFLIVILLIVLHIYKLNTVLLNNLKYINIKLKEMSSGENSKPNRLTLNSNDELSEIASSFNKIEDKLYNLVSKIKNGAFSIQRSVEILNTYNDDLAKKSEIQYHKVDIINNNLGQVKKIINFNYENTLKLNKLAKKTKKITEIISLESDHLSNTINQIFTGSEKIEKISTSIEELSFQTTILSLNSAVESTRIQNGSKSFDVISNEIHKLSTMGKSAAKEIKILSNENRIKIDESSFYLKNTIKLINTMVSKINDISLLLDDITKGSQSELNEISRISSSLSEIKSSAEETNSIAKDTLALNENLNNEALNFLDIIRYFDKKNYYENIDELLVENILTEEEKNKISNVLDISKKMTPENQI